MALFQNFVRGDSMFCRLISHVFFGGKEGDLISTTLIGTIFFLDNRHGIAMSDYDRLTGVKQLRVRGFKAVRFCARLKALALNIR